MNSWGMPMAAMRWTVRQASSVSSDGCLAAIPRTRFARCTVVACRAVPWSALPDAARSFIRPGHLYAYIYVHLYLI